MSQARISRREFLQIAGLTTAAVSVAACQVELPPEPPSDQEAVRLVYQDWRTDWFPGLAQEMLAIFHEQHPNIRVFYTPDPDNLEEAMLDEMEAGTAPDVFSGCCAFFPAWAQKGFALDLRPYVKAGLDEATIQDWSQAQYNYFFTSAGVQYALPKYNGGLALFYNKDLFDEVGVSYPDGSWDYDRYRQAMQALTLQQDGKPVRWGSMVDVSWDRLQIHANGWGGHFVNPDDPQRCDISKQPSLDAMEWLRARMWDDRVMATALDVENMETREAFVSQKIAMVEDGSWALKDILDKAPFRVGVAPFPVGPVRHATLSTTDGFAIYSGTQHPEQAWELLQFLVGPEYGRAMARAQFLQPARASLIPDWTRYIQEEYPEKASGLDVAAFADGQIKGYAVTAEIFPNMLEVTALARQTFDQILTLGQAPVSDLKNLCEQIETLQAGVSNLPGLCACEV
jgi:multiple sugar transport system substrate-binding protein